MPDIITQMPDGNWAATALGDPPRTYLGLHPTPEDAQEVLRRWHACAPAEPTPTPAWAGSIPGDGIAVLRGFWRAPSGVPWVVYVLPDAPVVAFVQGEGDGVVHAQHAGLAHVFARAAGDGRIRIGVVDADSYGALRHLVQLAPHARHACAHA